MHAAEAEAATVQASDFMQIHKIAMGCEWLTRAGEGGSKQQFEKRVRTVIKWTPKLRGSNRRKSMWTNPVPIKKLWFNGRDLIQFLSEFLLWKDGLKVLDRSQATERLQLWEIFFWFLPDTTLGIQVYIDRGSDVKCFNGSAPQLNAILWGDDK